MPVFRTGVGTVTRAGQRDGQAAHRRPARARRLRRRPGREGRPAARRDRPAHAPGAARAGAGAEGRATRRSSATPASTCSATASLITQDAATQQQARHAEGAGRPARGGGARPTTRRSTSRRCSSASRASSRRSAAASAPASSTPATSCTRPTPDGLVVINQIDPIAVLFTLPEDSFQDVNQRAARQRTSRCRWWPIARDSGEVLGSGKLILLNNQIDTDDRHGAAQGAASPNPRHTLWPGQYVNVRLVLRPRTACARRCRRRRCSAARTAPSSDSSMPDDKAVSQPVRVGPIQDGIAVIDERPDRRPARRRRRPVQAA